ncbi:MAG TPA: hypothetical protein VEI02_12860, partial [Planctomycetota bacterium]|nr:hypothetical protein [Planctomycetota bacterium]
MSADAPGFVRRTVASVRFRLFVTAWLLFALHFATNIQREHYPAMALAEDGTFRCDAFEPGFHSDIFRYRDGHAYIGNNLGTSVLVAPLLVLFDPVLDALEAREKRALRGEPAASRPAYDTTYRNRAELFRLVRERGWTLRFGAVAAITATLFVAPLSALCLVLLFDQLRRRAVSERRALVLAILFGFATPVFFRSANLTNNMPVMYAVFGAFLALFGGDGAGSASTRRHALAGFLCGLALFCDYAAVVACLVFGAAVAWRNLFASDRPSRGEGIRRILVFGLAAAPPIVALLWTQKVCFGGWFVIGQMAMPAVNYTDHGWRGFALPDPVTFGANNVDPRFGLFTWAPILALGLLPPRRRDVDAPLPRRSWLVAAAFVGAFLLFCAGNRYSRMQFNTGVRYLMPVVPFLFLSACNRLARLDGRVLALIAVPSVVHAWV